MIAKLSNYHIKNSISGSSFIKPPFHKVVAISYIDAAIYIDIDQKEEYRILNIKSGGDIAHFEAELIRGFLNYLRAINARLVTFNGRKFDLPVIKYRAMKYNITGEWLYIKGDRWNNYMHRYSLDWHCDLLEVFTDFGASTKVKMSEVAGIYKIPCKLDTDGSKTDSLYDQNQITAIRDYCEQDVVCTYLLYLKYAKYIGKVTNIGYMKSLEDLKKFICIQNKKHLLVFAN